MSALPQTTTHRSPFLKPYVVAATGHRPDKLWNTWDPDKWMPMIQVAKAFLFDRMEKAVLADYDGLHVISGMALGWDMIVAAAALMLRNEGHPIYLEAAVPFKGQDAIWRNDKARRWYARALETADMVTIVVPDIERDKNGKVVTHAAIKALDIRNHYMADRCHMLLACWDGTKGGTKNCLDYYKRKHPLGRTHNLYPQVKASMS